MKNKKPLIFILALFLSFAGIFYLMTRPSTFDKFKKELQGAATFEDIKEVSKNFSDGVSNNDKFQKLLVEKLDKMNLTDSEFIESSSLIKFGEEYLNLVIVPDLSNRLTKPKQVERDLELIETIYKSFAEYVQNKNVKNIYYKSNDKLTIDVSDRLAAGADFQKIANDLIVDLSEAKPPYRKTLKAKKGNFLKKTTRLYESGKANIRGADYWDYFNSKLKYNEKASKFSERYRNVVIFLSDGYLETQEKDYTRQKNIDLTNSKYDNWEILILEVNERDQGDYINLKQKWYAWLNNMHMKVDEKNFFQERLDATNKTKEVIESFISKGFQRSNTVSNVVSKSVNCSDNFDNTLKQASNLLDGSHSFDEIQSIKPLLSQAIVLKKEGCSSKNIQVKNKLTTEINNLLKSSETLAAQIDDADIDSRVEFYREVKSVVDEL